MDTKSVCGMEALHQLCGLAVHDEHYHTDKQDTQILVIMYTCIFVSHNLSKMDTIQLVITPVRGVVELHKCLKFATVLIAWVIVLYTWS